MEFSNDYKLHTTHLQRLATELRVPLFEGYTMPASYQDSESAALYKQLLTRPLHVPITEEPEDVRLVHAFSPLCCSTASGAFDASVDGRESIHAGMGSVQQ